MSEEIVKEIMKYDYNQCIEGCKHLSPKAREICMFACEVLFRYAWAHTWNSLGKIYQNIPED